ncbi:MAG: hypothetical protein KF687_14390 [Cyclobacteriaceae bacterium]|nr:hypothetical protein [Cyclobacteriaceae bacterium]
MNCNYCQKTLPESSKFCVYCGKEVEIKIVQRNAENTTVIETHKKSPVKIVSSFFNILIFLAAIASILGFFYIYVENKIKSPADKSPINDEIVDNLYRNTKYQFRIKFPETWEIKKGDGPNILVKASSGKGGSINIYVKDLGIALGDIDDMLSIEEWTNSVYEKFPSAKILEQKEIYIDNKKAYFVQYTITYKVLEHQTNGIFYIIGLINKNYLYAITAGSVEGQFEDEKPILDASVSTFVIEDY